MATENEPSNPPRRRPPLSFYTVDVASVIKDNARKLLHEYSKIPEDQITDHVVAMRKKAFAIHPYPCIGMYRFLDLTLPQLDVYPGVVSRLKAGDTFLDIGCCFGQEIRQLVHDGVPAENLYGSDLREAYFDMGYDLFKDRESLKSTFIMADIFDNESNLFEQLTEKVDIMFAGAFFHLFELEQQKVALKQAIKLLSPKPGTLVVGRQVGNIFGGAFEPDASSGARAKFRHSEETWKKLWSMVGDETETKWDVHVALFSIPMGPESSVVPISELKPENGGRVMIFVVKKI